MTVCDADLIAGIEVEWMRKNETDIGTGIATEVNSTT